MASSPHIILFPFMSKGHTIPLLHLTKLLHKHRPQATFTIFTTPANEPFISLSLSSLPSNLLNIISLPFTSDLIPPGVESTDKLPSMSLFFTFTNATEHLQGGFESALGELLRDDINTMRTTFLVSDGFLYWTQESASKFNLPRLVYYGMSAYAQVIFRLVMSQKQSTSSGPDELIHVPEFPSVRVTRNDFGTPLNKPGEGDHPLQALIVKCATATSKSYGELINSFHELEPEFLEFKCSNYKPRSWSIGPFCLADQPRSCFKSGYIDWLDTKRTQKTPVLYVAFGSQAEMSADQLKEIAVGLEMSGAHFLWALRIKPNQEAIMEGFQDRVKERGLIVREWVEQRKVLHHESVEGFLSHCGWNSVSESISAGVPILAWPLSAEQPLNARMVEDEIKVGLRVETNVNSSLREFVKREEISKVVKKLMGGEEGEVVRKRVKELSEAANKAIQEGGSSWKNLESLLNELENNRSILQEVRSKGMNGRSNVHENENGSSSLAIGQVFNGMKM